MMDQKNLILAIVVSVAILLGYQILFEQPKLKKEAAEKAAHQQTTSEVAKTAPSAASGANAPAPSGAMPPAGGTAPAPGATPVPAGNAAPAPAASRQAALARVPRIAISTPAVDGSVSLDAARIDDVRLRQYHETPDQTSPEIEFLSPPSAPHPYFAEFGWVAAGGETAKLPGPDTVWHANHKKLTPSTPVTLSWNNGQGLTFERTIAVDDHYMFTVTQRVKNESGRSVTLLPYGLVSRWGTPPKSGTYLLHVGGVGVQDGTLHEVDYDDMEKPVTRSSTGGWLGFTDKYWLAALIPAKGEKVTTRYTHFMHGKTPVYQADYLAQPQTVAPGATTEVTDRLFSGAKEVHLLAMYEQKLGIDKFTYAVDWGWFSFLTKPIFYVLDYFKGIVGNFAIAILMLTVLIKLAFFPLANKSYRAMSRMKTLQPKMMELRERYKEDKARLNQEMMALYKKENANPMAGCLPMVIQIPVFFALYKVLYVTIEMRHAPFFGWVHDLSAPDPTSILNLFGVFHWTPPHEVAFLAIGAWPVIMGITMFLQQRLNPAPPDPVQQKMFMLLPVVFTFMLAHFPVGLVIYWSWNNTLSIAQQWVIMRRAGIKRTPPPKKAARKT